MTLPGPGGSPLGREPNPHTASACVDIDKTKARVCSGDRLPRCHSARFTIFLEPLGRLCQNVHQKKKIPW